MVVLNNFTTLLANETKIAAKTLMTEAIWNQELT